MGYYGCWVTRLLGCIHVITCVHVGINLSLALNEPSLSSLLLHSYSMILVSSSTDLSISQDKTQINSPDVNSCPPWRVKLKSLRLTKYQIQPCFFVFGIWEIHQLLLRVVHFFPRLASTKSFYKPRIQHIIVDVIISSNHIFVSSSPDVTNKLDMISINFTNIHCHLFKMKNPFIQPHEIPTAAFRARAPHPQNPGNWYIFLYLWMVYFLLYMRTYGYEMSLPVLSC